MKIIVEHLEPELFEWCLIEYGHISEIVGKNSLIFTDIKNKEDFKKLRKFGSVFEKNISELKLNNVCILSQYSKSTLKTDDKNKFKYFVFGGILGDNPARKRTNILIKNLKKQKINFEERSLGNVQMPIDTAVYVSKKILQGKKFSDFRFVDEVEIEINENESVKLPFRFIVDNNKLVINEKLVDYLRKKKEF